MRYLSQGTWGDLCDGLVTPEETKNAAINSIVVGNLKNEWEWRDLETHGLNREGSHVLSVERRISLPTPTTNRICRHRGHGEITLRGVKHPRQPKLAIEAF